MGLGPCRYFAPVTIVAESHVRFTSGSVAERPHECPALMSRAHCLRIWQTVVRLFLPRSGGSRGIGPSSAPLGPLVTIMACPRLCAPARRPSDDCRERSADLRRRHD